MFRELFPSSIVRMYKSALFGNRILLEHLFGYYYIYCEFDVYQGQLVLKCTCVISNHVVTATLVVNLIILFTMCTAKLFLSPLAKIIPRPAWLVGCVRGPIA